MKETTEKTINHEHHNHETHEKETKIYTPSKKMESCITGDCDQKKGLFMIAVVILLVANLIVWLVNVNKPSAADVKSMEVGGEENYQKLQKIWENESFKNNVTQQMDQAMVQMQQEKWGMKWGNWELPNQASMNTNNKEMKKAIPTTTSENSAQSPEMRGDK